MDDNQKPKRQRNAYLKFTSVAVQMGLTIYLGNLLGKWLDVRFNKNFWEDTITLVSVFLAMYQVIAQVIKASKNND
ncbi:MAG TPA: AtpZ/AtpI family protein [Vicingaceae bacterium]|nr:AtpZ/AtpI family protein [Vicingaceae bacterium]